MKFIVFLGLVVVAAAAPQQAAQILRQENDIQPDGYQFSYETSNGIAAEEKGSLQNVGAENPALQVAGQYGYTAEDGTQVQLSYIANENGYQPQGAHLPTPPPVPAAILRSIEYNAAHPAPAARR